MSFAFWVAASLSCLWTHESILRIFAISNRYGFNPERSITPRKIDSWVFGEQAATTTRLIFSFLIVSSISCWVFPAQENIWCEAQTTSGSVRANFATRSTSTTPAILLPQWHTKTPTLGVSISSIASTSIGSGHCRLVRWLSARAAAALPSETLSGISFGPETHPAT